MYDGVGALIVLQDQCKVHIQLDAGWTTHAVLKADSAVDLVLGLDNKSLVVGAGVRLDTSFHVAGNIHLAEGSSTIHPKGHKCSEIATENSAETIDGDMDLQTNVTLHLKPKLVGNWSTGFHLTFIPTVAVAGELVAFDAKVFSHVEVFGIQLSQVSALVDKKINAVLTQEMAGKLVQQELAKLQVKLQAAADKIWPPASQGKLPGLTQQYLTPLQAAVDNIATSQAANYP